nr:protein of unknown function (DUF982) [uncultured bacterium]
MTDKPFDEPVPLKLDGVTVFVTSAQDAADFLMQDWPTHRTQRHREALEACLKVLEGYRSVEDARVALVAAAKEAKLLA